MAALVADYDSTSSGETESASSSESDETGSEDNDGGRVNEEEPEKLPLPDILNDGLSTSGKGQDSEEKRSCSVFFNPFKAKEDAKLAILEKHVKLSEARNESERERGKFGKKKKGQRRQNVDTRNEADAEGFKTVGKRRIGVSDSIVPPKKSLKAYGRQRQQQERERTVP